MLGQAQRTGAGGLTTESDVAEVVWRTANERLDSSRFPAGADARRWLGRDRRRVATQGATFGGAGRWRERLHGRALSVSPSRTGDQVVAQPGDQSNGIHEVAGSIPASSTNLFNDSSKRP